MANKNSFMVSELIVSNLFFRYNYIIISINIPIILYKKSQADNSLTLLSITTILNIIKRSESFYHVSMVQYPARFPNGMHCPHRITDIHSTHFHLR